MTVRGIRKLEALAKSIQLKGWLHNLSTISQADGAVVNDSFEAFEIGARAHGFDEVLKREWAPHAEVDTHTHPFGVQALIVRGELWLTSNEQTRHLKAGDTFDLGRGVPHSERYGAEGCSFWVARRHGLDAVAA